MNEQANICMYEWRGAVGEGGDGVGGWMYSIKNESEYIYFSLYVLIPLFMRIWVHVEYIREELEEKANGT